MQPRAFPAAQGGAAAAALGGSGGGSPKRSPAGQSATAASPEARRAGSGSQPGPREGGTNQHGAADASQGPVTAAAHLDPATLPARANSSSASTPLLHMVGRWAPLKTAPPALLPRPAPITRPYAAAERTPRAAWVPSPRLLFCTSCRWPVGRAWTVPREGSGSRKQNYRRPGAQGHEGGQRCRPRCAWRERCRHCPLRRHGSCTVLHPAAAALQLICHGALERRGRR